MPHQYTCQACGDMGNHWIMDCKYDPLLNILNENVKNIKKTIKSSFSEFEQKLNNIQEDLELLNNLKSLYDDKCGKYIKYNDKLLVFGYLRTQFKQINIIATENLISFTCLAFYSDDCDQFISFNGPHNISSDSKCLSGCGYGKYEIDPNNTKYTRYQWVISLNYIHETNGRCLLGLTSYADTTNNPWCYNLDIIQYNFHSQAQELFWPSHRFEPEYHHLIEFRSGDIVILDLDLNKKEFNLYINGVLGGSHKNINIHQGIKYRLGALVYYGIDYITIEKFTKFKDDDDHDDNNNLFINRDKFDFKPRSHPNGEIDIDIDHSRLRLVYKRYPDAKICPYFDPIAKEWTSLLYSAQTKSIYL